MVSIPEPAVRRLSLYLRHLEDLTGRGTATISSRQLADALGASDAQVRKDLAYFGQFGRPRIGYRVEDLVTQIRHILGTDHVWDVLLVGAGNLGRALVAYRGFLKKGFRITIAFDTDPAKAGQSIGGITVRPLAELGEAVRSRPVRVAILAVPAESAQAVADVLVAAGIRGILNFAPVSLSVPESVAVAGVDLATQLEQLSFRVRAGQ